MKLNDHDYLVLEDIVKILERDRYSISSKQLKMIIRKIKRDN